MLQANTLLRESDNAGAFEDYSLYLYRQSAPVFTDRVRELEQKLRYPVSVPIMMMMMMNACDFFVCGVSVCSVFLYFLAGPAEADPRHLFLKFAFLLFESVTPRARCLLVPNSAANCSAAFLST